MNNHIGPNGRQGCSNTLEVADIYLEELALSQPANAFQVGLLPSGRVEVIQAVDDRELRSTTQQSLGEVRANEAGTACQYYPVARLVHVFLIAHRTLTGQAAGSFRCSKNAATGTTSARQKAIMCFILRHASGMPFR
jgi:hypothetical protein